MKKIIYILSLVLFLGSCVKEQAGISAATGEEGKITLNLTAIVPDAQPLTKAMGEKPQLTNLYLAVFDEVGYLAEYVKAQDVELATENGVTCKYTVTLSLSDKPRTIHWIGNAPAAVMYGSEESVMMGLIAKGNEDTYWYRKVLYKVDAVSVEGGIKPSDNLVKELSNIPLIRNFAKIKLEDNASSFELKSYAVVNTMNESYTVAYDFKKGEFKKYMKEMENGQLVPKTYVELLNEGYDASTPTIATYVTLEEAWRRRVKADEAYYVYEREKPLSSPAYIIAYGRYEYAETDSYYKINLRNEEDEYMPLLRNFQYTINLNAVYRNGYASPEEAAASTGSGDVSTAIETESLIYMSDGTASLEVEYTDIVTTTEEPLSLRFAFYPDLRNSSTLYKGAQTEFNESIEFIINKDYGASGAAIAALSEVNYSGDVPTIEIIPTKPEDTPKSQTITVLAHYTPNVEGGIPRSIQRTVKVTVMNDQLMTIKCVPSEVPNIMGSEFAVNVSIPAGLSRGMFPLDFMVESKNLCITPDLDKNYMNVETGKSVTGSGKPAYFFTKSLSWMDYQKILNIEGKKTFEIYLATTKANSETDIYVANEYFYGGVVNEERISYASTSLGNYIPLYFKNLTFNPSSVPSGLDVRVAFSFTINEIPEDGKVLLAMVNVAPDENEERLKLKEVVDGIAHYEYVATSTGSHTVDLITTSADGQLKVTLSAYHFMDESLSATRSK